MGAVRNVLAEFGAVARDRNLRRLELAYGAAITSEWAFVVALGVFAYERGGATAVGILGLVLGLVLFTVLVWSGHGRIANVVGLGLLGALVAASASLRRR